MDDDNPTAEPRFVVTSRRRGHAHVVLQGTSAADVTAENVRKRFYHPYFGGRSEWAKDGRFGVIVHTD